jgi:RNA polymerase sigma-70 factor (ECF subfamily)
MSAGFAHSPNRGLPEYPVVEESRNAKEVRLVAAAKNGCGAAFGELCQLYAKWLLPKVLLITRNREDAEDALQDSFLRAFVHIKGFDGRSKFSTWLTRIAINSALMILRRRRNSLELSLSDDANQGVLEVSDRLPNPEMSCAQREREEVLRSAVGRLRPRLQRVLQLRQLEEHSMRETALILDVSVRTAKARLFRARASLRRSAVIKAIFQARNETAA